MFRGLGEHRGSVFRGLDEHRGRCSGGWVNTGVGVQGSG